MMSLENFIKSGVDPKEIDPGDIKNRYERIVLLIYQDLLEITGKPVSFCSKREELETLKRWQSTIEDEVIEEFGEVS